ncbi:PspA/IM30 family protein [Streptomyces sediminimaris]|uniref:PspA/IM30 family protein n=1 Tax=Streptomyces sediminimaris TaxID=3383721 RepID=UPI00399BC6A1
MPARLTFTLAGRDELSRVLNNTADASDRLRLRMAGITGDADGRLRDLQGNLLSTADAQRRLDDRTGQVRGRFDEMSKAGEKLGESLRANLISLAPAAIPASAALANSAGVLAGQLGAVAVAAVAYGVALKPQITAISDAVDAQTKYEDAVRTSGATSQEAIKAQVAYQQQLDKMPPATRQAAVAVGLLRDNFQHWSDSLAGDVMGPFNKGVAIANDLLPKTSGLVKGASAQFDRLVTELGGAIETPGFDKVTGKFTDFADTTMDHAVDELNIFLAKLNAGEYDNSGFSTFLDYARANGPAVWETLQNLGDALLNVLQAGSDVGVGMLDVVNVLSDIVAAVPPDAIATILQLAIAIKAVRLAAVGADAAKAAMLAIATQVAAMNTAAAAAPTRLAGVTAAIGGLSRGAKLAVAGTGLGLLLVALTELSSHSQKPKPDVDKLTTSLKSLAETGKVTGEAARTFGKDLSGLGDAFQKAIDPKGLDQFQQSIISFFGTDSTPVKNAKEDIDAVDKALANLVSSGQADLAAAALDHVMKKLKAQGFSAKEVEGQLDDYRDALAGQALEQQLAAESMGLFGTQAQTVQAQLDAQKQSADGLRQSIQALNDVQRSALDGQIGFEAAIDAASKAAKDNAGVLDMQGGKLVTNTDKQRAAAQALSDLAAKTDSATASARESGASWSEVSSIYQRGRAAFIKSAEAMGLTRAQAKALADQILKTPNKTAYLKGNLQDLQAKLATARRQLRSVPDARRAQVRATIADLERKIRIAKDALNNLDGYSATTWIYTNYATPHHMATGGLLHRAHGGPIPGFPGGGHIMGPGTATSDSVLLWGSNGEYVVKAASVQKYGLKFMEALNNGALPVGRAAPRAGLPAVPDSATVSAGGSDRPAVTYNVYPRASVISVEDLQLLQRQEEARQRVGRPE